MLAISLAALLLLGASQQANAGPEHPNQDQARPEDSAQSDSLKSQTAPKSVQSDADRAAMNQPPKGSQGLPLKGSKAVPSDPAF